MNWLMTKLDGMFWGFDYFKWKCITAFYIWKLTDTPILDSWFYCKLMEDYYINEYEPYLAVHEEIENWWK